MKNATPKVSVILPVYNVENYLEQCLDSILNQTYQNLEIVVVDDGSTDRSGEICDAYALRHSNLKVIHKENAGLGMARNTGLEIATGDFVYFFDSDDFLDKEQISELVTTMVSSKVDACYVGFIATDQEGVPLYERAYEDMVYSGDEVMTKFMPRMIGSSPKIKDGVEMSASAQMYSLRLIQKHHIRFVSEQELISEDLVFNLDYLKFSEGVATVKKIGNYYRSNPTSLSRSYRSDRFEKSKHFYLYIVERLQKENAEKETFYRAEKGFFINIRMSIAQELLKSCPHDKQEKKARILEICNDEVVRQAISDYPVRQLGIKQQVFLLFVKHRMVFLLTVLLKKSS